MSEANFQVAEARLPHDVIRARLAALQPEIAWCHRFDFGNGITTILPDQPNYSKAKGLKIIGREIVGSIPYITKKGRISDLTVLDLACAEGAHAIEFAAEGAKRVLGIEGRQLYVDRAAMAAEAYGLQNVTFRQGDVRSVDANNPGVFDLVLFFGILHHLDGDAFFDMLKRLRSVTGDTMVLYTHTSEPGCEARFGKRLSEERGIAGGYRGRFYVEHPKNATPEERALRVRNSLDNTYSFWPRENSLIQALRNAGFQNISKLMHPSPFGNPAGDYRVLYICR